MPRTRSRPFGARGANSGIQDTDNLVWKLKLVLDGKAPERLLDTYRSERVHAADENLMNSTRRPTSSRRKSNASRTFRNAVLTLAEHHPFARALVNSVASVPAFLTTSSLNTPDEDEFSGRWCRGRWTMRRLVSVVPRPGCLIRSAAIASSDAVRFTDVADRLGDKLERLRN